MKSPFPEGSQMWELFELCEKYRYAKSICGYNYTRLALINKIQAIMGETVNPDQPDNANPPGKD